MRVLRRAGPSAHESKHFLKASEFFAHEVNRFLKKNGLDVAMNVFFKALVYGAGERLAPHRAHLSAAASTKHFARG